MVQVIQYGVLWSVTFKTCPFFSESRDGEERYAETGDISELVINGSRQKLYRNGGASDQ
jgi:hypothetical protein